MQRALKVRPPLRPAGRPQQYAQQRALALEAYLREDA